MLAGRLFVRALAVCLLFATHAAAQTTYTLSGTVYGGGSTLPNTIVEALVDGTATVAAQTTTSGAGQYALSLADGTYDLRVTPPAGSGYGQETVQNVTISGANRTYDVVLLSSSVGSISGVVSGRDGKPVPNVTVRAYVGPTNNTAQTDAQGRYSLQAANGTAYMEFYGGGAAGVSPANFYVERYNIAVNGPTVVNVSLPVFMLSGRVLDPNGAPVAGATLNLSTAQYFNNGRESSSAFATTDAQGAYSMLLLAGSGGGTARPPAGSTLVPTSRSFTLTADAQLDFTLGAAVQITGTVTGRNGQPVPNVTVRAYVGPSNASAQTDGQGRYSVLAANGTAYMEFYGGGAAGVTPANFYVERYNIAVNGGAVVDVALPVHLLSGRVLDPAGVGVAGATLNLSTAQYLNNGRESSSAFATTDAQGGYSMLLLAGSGGGTARPPSGSNLVPVSKSFALTADSQLDFTLGAAVEITGIVRGRNGQPVPNVTVRAYVGPSNNSVQTGSDGRYRVLAANGTAYMEFYGGGPATVAPPNFYVERYNISVTGPTTVDVDLPVLSVTGAVTDSNGSPVPNVALNASTAEYLNNGRHSSSAWATSDAQGAYGFLLLKGNGSFQINPPAATGFLRASVPLNLATDLTQRVVLQRPDLSPPQIVAGPVVVHLSDDSVSVSWTTNEASSSRVEYGIGAMTLAVTDNTMTTNHTVTLLNLTPLSIYAFRVGSTDSSGNGPVYSAPGTFTTQGPPGDITPPVITSGPTVVFVDQTSGLIQWTTDEPASSSLSFGLSETLGTTVAGPAGKFTQSHSIRLTGLTPETRYYAQVASVDPDGNAMAGSVFSFGTLAVPDTAAPVITAGPAVTSITDTKITVTWTTNEPATSGVSYNDGTQFFVVSDAALTRSHEITLSGLTPQRRYYITVSSTDAVGNGPTLGGPIEATTAATPDTTAPAISNVQVIDITETSAVVIWTTDERGTSAVSYGTASGVLDHTKADVSAVTVHRLSLTGLLDGTTYYLTVSSTDASGNTSTSEEITFKTVSAFVDMPPSAPGPITGPSGPTRAESFDLSWGASTDDVGIGSYDVVRNGQVVATVGADVTTYTESGLAEGGYEYQIRAADTAGHTASSAVFAVLVDRTAPVVDVPADIMADAIGTAATVTFATSATDNVDGAVSASCAPASGSSFPVGQTTVTCSAQDAAGNAGSRSFVVTVRDVTAPTLRLPADRTLEATEPAGAIATFAASADDLVDGAVTATCSPVSGSVFGIGTSTVQCSATDRAGNTATGTFSVTVTDTTGPEIADVVPSQIELWPPNHQLVPVTIAVKVSDIADTAPACRIVQVTSSEPDNGLGDGDTPNDSIVEGPLRVQLRAERSGKGSGRTYTIAVDCRDAAGNRTAAATTVFVPHSRAKK